MLSYVSQINLYFIKYDCYSYVPFVCSNYYIAETALHLYVIGIVREYKPSLASALPGMFKCLHYALNNYF